MIADYRWARSIGFTRRGATRMTVKALSLSRYDPPTFVMGKTTKLARNRYGHPIPNREHAARK